MRRPNIYSKVLRAGICLVAVFLQSGCLRRPLWIYTDEFRQVELITDWDDCPSAPDGMTAWFMNDNLSGQNSHITTAEVYHAWLNLPRGVFTGIVFDYSPNEYGAQDFLWMHRPDSALVRARYYVNQPPADEDLYGGFSVPEGMLLPTNPVTQMFLLSNTPEQMCVDTLKHVEIVTGADGDLILWEDRDEFESSLTIQTFYARPRPIIWRLRVYVELRGYDYMSSVKGTFSGLADGIRLACLQNTDEPCLHPMDAWQGSRNMDNTGTITSTINTFGLCESWYDENAQGDSPYLFRLNLQFLLRDNRTVVNYHYDVPRDKMEVYADQCVLRLEIPIEFGPDLPYVDAEGSAGFDAEVSPWEDGGSADVGM